MNTRDATNTAFAELTQTGLISVEGADAVAFLHAQVTSDIAGLALERTQYSGYCNPKGRLLATFLVWKEAERVFLQLPRELREPVQSRLAKYVLRSKVVLADATAAHALFGVWGAHAARAVAALPAAVPAAAHEIAVAEGIAVARLAAERYLVRAETARADAVRAALRAHTEHAALEWARLDIESGIPVVTVATQDQYVPQMLNLELIGGVSYTKGCYPGQEIVARTHYLGRLKQRTFRVHVPADAAPAPGDPLYSAAFGEGQASGAILNAVSDPAGGYEALAVIQTAAASGASVHWRSPQGPAVALKTLPYAIPD